MDKEQLKALLEDMSLKEKIGQLVQLMGVFYLEDQESVLTGPGRELGLTQENLQLCGSILGTYGAEKLRKIQTEYMKIQPHHIPMLFMMDVIHGMKTIFPMPLALGAAFEPELLEQCAAASAKEAAASGLHVVFSPMADLARDARWGRVMESPGEDPYLNALCVAAQVRGFQGEDLSDPDRVCACVKHFAAYGAPIAGREYNTVELCEHTFREFYIKAYQAGIDAGAAMVMTAFNTVNGIPATANRELMRGLLRREMGFDGVLISDFSAILETVAHGYAEDSTQAAKAAIESGVDIDMMTSVYSSSLEELVRSGQIEESLIDESAMRVLELKNRLGLFENPFRESSEEKEKQVLLCPEHRQLARETARKTFVLLKNEEEILPLDPRKKIAFIGPYTDRKMLNSSWAVTGNYEDCVTIRSAAEEVFDPQRTSYQNGCPVLDDGYRLVGFTEHQEETYSETEKRQMFMDALNAAKQADLVVMPLGEHYLQSGEATSRAMLDLPEVQMELFREVRKVNENIVVVLFGGRPLDLREISRDARAVLEVWMPGTEGGHAIIDVLTGKWNPSGRLSISFPYCVGQVPVFYNEYTTGRPNLPGINERFRSKYIDIPNAPLYPFGYGLSYTQFRYGPANLDGSVLTAGESITAQATVKNTGERAGLETVQLYIRDVAASVVRPVKELKGFRKIWLEPGEEKTVTFEISEPMLRFVGSDGTVESEPGEFRLWIAGNSAVQEEAAVSFELI